MKTTFVAIGIALKVIDDEFHCFMQTRSEDGPLDGFLEFPGGKIEEGEEAVAALVREFKEEVDADLNHHHLFKIYPYEYPDRNVILYTYLVDGADLELKGGSWFKFLEDNDISGLQNKILEANQQIFEDLRVYLKSLIESETIDYLWMSSNK